MSLKAAVHTDSRSAHLMLDESSTRTLRKWDGRCKHQQDDICSHFSFAVFNEVDVFWITVALIFWPAVDVYGCVSAIILIGNNTSFVSAENSEVDNKCRFMRKQTKDNTEVFNTQRMSPLNSAHWNRQEVKGQNTFTLSAVCLRVEFKGRGMCPRHSHPFMLEKNQAFLHTYSIH